MPQRNSKDNDMVSSSASSTSINLFIHPSVFKGYILSTVGSSLCGGDTVVSNAKALPFWGFYPCRRKSINNK